MLSCLFSCFHCFKQLKTCFYEVLEIFFITMIWPGVVKDEMKKSEFRDEVKFQISLISSSGKSLAGIDLLTVNNKHSRTECAIFL